MLLGGYSENQRCVCTKYDWMNWDIFKGFSVSMTQGGSKWEKDLGLREVEAAVSEVRGSAARDGKINCCALCSSPSS